MKKIIAFSLTILLIIKYTISEFLVDSEEAANARFEWNRKYAANITSSRVDFSYNEQQGTFCDVKKDLFAKEFVFKIPKEFIICGFDMFPYKFEIKDAMLDFLRSKYGNNLNETKTKSNMYIFASYLAFLDYNNKEKVFEAAKAAKKDYYLIDATEEQQSYLKSVPPVIYTNHMYDQEEFLILERSGMFFDRSTEIKQAHTFLIEWLDKKPEIKKVVKPWLENFDNFRYWTGIIASRAYRASLADYERIRGVNILDTFNGAANKQMLTEILTPELNWSCLIPFIDLCNHHNANDPDMKDKTEFILNFNKGGINVGFSTAFKAGDEYNYAYVPFSPNEKLLYAYGFYVEGNGQSMAHVMINISKNLFTKQKYDLALKLKCFEQPFDNFFNSAHQNANIQLPIYPHKLNNNLLNTCRIYIVPVNNFNADFIHKRLTRNQWISYENEIQALTLYRFTVMTGIKRAAYSYEDLLQSLQNTRTYFKENRAEIIAKPMMRFKYRLRRRIMEVARENRSIHYINLNYAHKKITELLSDQFKKLRSHYISL